MVGLEWLLGQSDDELGRHDIAAVNLACTRENSTHACCPMAL
jgi:hypothetical protein